MATKIKVTGMSCQHCINHVTKALEDAKLKNVKVDLEAGEATFDNPGSITMEDIEKAIDEAGYGVG